jgi:broad specificity phosphatase PhoE
MNKIYKSLFLLFLIFVQHGKILAEETHSSTKTTDDSLTEEVLKQAEENAERHEF